MNAVKAIRNRLGQTQKEFADGIAVSQGSVAFYEDDKTVLPAVALRIIEHAEKNGLALSMDQVYGLAPLPTDKASA